MNTDIIKKKIERTGISSKDIESIIAGVTNIINSFTYANEDVDRYAIYLVLKNTGGYKLFKTIDNVVLFDKLDSTYTESRELIGVGAWNIKRALKIQFTTNDNLLISDVDSKELHRVVFSLVEPTSIKYVVWQSDETNPVIITVDYDMYKGLSYAELQNCITDSYYRIVKSHNEVESKDTYAKTPTCYAVNYCLEGQEVDTQCY